MTSYTNRPIAEAAFEHISTKIVPAIYPRAKSYQIFRETIERSKARRFKYTKENKIVAAPTEVAFLSDTSNVEEIKFDTSVIPIGQMNQKFEIKMEHIIESVNHGFQNVESIFRASSMKHFQEYIDQKLLYSWDATEWYDTTLPAYGLHQWPGIQTATTTSLTGTRYSSGGQTAYNDFLKIIKVFDSNHLDLDGVRLKIITTPQLRRSLGGLSTYDHSNMKLIMEYCRDENIIPEFWSSPKLIGSSTETSGTAASWVVVHPDADVRIVEFGGITTTTDANNEFLHKRRFDLSYGGMLFVGQPKGVVKMSSVWF